MLKYYPSAKPKTYYCLYWSECYYEEPYVGKPHVRICEGLRLRGLSLLDYRTVTLFQIIWLAYKYFIWQIMHWEHFSKKEKKRKLLVFWRVLFTTLMEDWIVIWIKKNKKVEKRNLLLTYAEWRGKITFVAGKYINKQWQKLEKLVAVRQRWIVTKYFKKI